MARFLITPEWKGAKVPGGQGQVVLRLTGRDCASGKVRRVRVNTDVTGVGDRVLSEKREEVVRLIRMLYTVIIRRVETGGVFGVDDVVSDYREVHEQYPDVMKGDEDVSLRGDIVSLGGGFNGDFRFVYPVDEKAAEGLVEYIAGLEAKAKNEGKDSRGRTLSSTRRSLKRFLDGGDVRLTDVDREFVEDYSEWLSDEGVSDSTQSFYLRSLRLALNQAKEDGIFLSGENLFAGLNTRVIFKEKDVSVDVCECGEGAPLPSQRASHSRQLSRETMWRIANMDLSEDAGLMVVRDMFMFAFYCRGMELTDVMNLTKECVHEGMLTYRRRGTGRMKSVILDEKAMSIIQRYRGGEGAYLFPLMGMHRGLRQYSVNGVVRRSLRRIGEMAGELELTFGMNITTWQSLVAQIDPAVMLRGSA